MYGINFAPELTGIGKYTGEMAAWLALKGHDVRMVAAPPYYPDWAVGADYSARIWQREHWQGVDVWRCPLWVPTRLGGAKRLLHLASFALSSLPVMLRQILWRPDVVWVVEPALFCTPAALAVARLSNAQAWLHVQDFEVDAAFDLGLLRGRFLRRVVAGAERWLMRRFDVVSTISQRMHQRLLAKGVAPANAVLAPNWVDVQSITPSGREISSPVLDYSGSVDIKAGPSAKAKGVNNSFRLELSIPAGAVVALYSGNMGGKQGLELLADVAKLCLAQAAHTQPAIVFVFCGNGAGRADLVRRCAGLANVHFLELQPIERLNELLAMADIHLLPQRADAADLVMPSKLTGMLASGRPILATAHPGTELADVVQGCGVAVPPEDPAAMAQALAALAADSTRRKKLGAAGRVYALAHLDREAVLKKLESAMIAISSRR